MKVTELYVDRSGPARGLQTISDRPLLIGAILARSARRAERRAFWRRLFGLERAARTIVVRFPGGETIYSPGR